jgi:preprotein translocase SecE subunit
MADEPSKRPRRLVKNPETFRERALKATQATEAPKRRVRLGGFISHWLHSLFGPIGRFLARVFSVQPFRTIAKVARWIGLIIVPVYFRNSWKELRLVAWPNWQQSRQLTFAVLMFAIVFGGAIAGVDYGLDKLFRHILLK